MTIKIPLVGKWWLTSDSQNWILAEKSGERLIFKSFYGSLENAIISVLDLHLRGLDVATLAELQNEIKRASAVVCKAIMPLRQEKRE